MLTEANIDHLKCKIAQLHDLHNKMQVGDDVFVIEECGELAKELMKCHRAKGSKEHVVEEACDVLTTVLTLLYGLDVRDTVIANEINLKVNRAVDRYMTTGEK